MIGFVRLLLATLLLGTGSIAAAQESEEGEWEFLTLTYLLVPSVNGDITVRGREAELDMSPTDIFSNLNFGFMGYAEANNGRIGIAGDIIYSNIDASDDDRLAEIDTTQTDITVMGFYRVSRRIELYGGARYNNIGADINFQGPLGADTRSADVNWIDPLVGARYRTPLTENLNFVLMADLGGFGLGSDMAVHVWPVFTYDLSNKFSAALGYRYLYTKYDRGSGDTLFEWDTSLSGPVVGLVARF